MICQKLLFLVTSLILRLLKWCFFGDFKRFEQSLYFNVYSDQFSMFLSVLKISLSLDIFIIASQRAFPLKVLFLFCTIFSFEGQI